MNHQITRIFDFVGHQLANTAHERCLNYKEKNQWKAISTESFSKQIDQASHALLALGVAPNDKIAVITKNNNPNWHILDTAVLQIGAQNVPLYATLSKKDYEYILNHSDAKFCFVSDTELYDKVLAVKERTGLEDIFLLNNLNTSYDWNSFLSKGKNIDYTEEIAARKKQVKPEDLATIIYTSGTTGIPKGVMLSHHNIVFTVFQTAKRLHLEASNKRTLSYLPVCHIFERAAFYYNLLMSFEIYFAESIETLGDNIKEVKPHYLAVVPRLLEKMYDKIIEKGSQLSLIKKALFFLAVGLGKRYKPYHQNSRLYYIQLNIARKIIFSKWQEALGGHLLFMIAGSAPLQANLIRVFTAAGISIYEGYGMTESSPAGTLNDLRNQGLKIGTVGKPLDGVEIKIGSDGEILIKGENVMMGYYKNEDLTHKTIIDGYLHTGDIGEIDEDGFLSITDRKKEIFKTSGGKYIAPTSIESELKQSRFIEQIMVIGEGEKMPAALIQPNFHFIEEWAKLKNYPIDDIATDKRVIDRIQKEVDFYNEKFGKWERIKKFELTPDEWSIEAGHLTPTMKIKRKVIKEKYKSLYEKIYNSQ